MRIAVIGAGNWGKNLVRTFHALGVLAAVADKVPALREAVAHDFPDVRVFEDHATLLEDDRIDAVAVATPAPTHYAVARAALLAGKDVFV